MNESDDVNDDSVDVVKGFEEPTSLRSRIQNCRKMIEPCARHFAYLLRVNGDNASFIVFKLHDLGAMFGSAVALAMATHLRSKERERLLGTFMMAGSMKTSVSGNDLHITEDQVRSLEILHKVVNAQTDPLTWHAETLPGN